MPLLGSTTCTRSPPRGPRSQRCTQTLSHGVIVQATTSLRCAWQPHSDPGLDTSKSRPCTSGSVNPSCDAWLHRSCREDHFTVPGQGDPVNRHGANNSCQCALSRIVAGHGIAWPEAPQKPPEPPHGTVPLGGLGRRKGKHLGGPTFTRGCVRCFESLWRSLLASMSARRLQ
jgi:hypothetical protein